MRTEIDDPKNNVYISGVYYSDTGDLSCAVTWDIDVSKGPKAASLSIRIEHIKISYRYMHPDSIVRIEDLTGAATVSPPEEDVSIDVNPAEDSAWDVSVVVEDGFDTVGDIAPKFVNADEQNKKVVVYF